MDALFGAIASRDLSLDRAVSDLVSVSQKRLNGRARPIDVGTAIRAIAQDRQIMPLMGVNTRRLYIVTSALGGALAGLAACLLVLLYDVHPFIGLSIGPITFLICVLGGLGNFVGGFVAAFVFAEIIQLGGLFSDLEWGYVLAFGFFIVMMFIRPRGLLARRS